MVMSVVRGEKPFLSQIRTLTGPRQPKKSETKESGPSSSATATALGQNQTQSQSQWNSPEDLSHLATLDLLDMFVNDDLQVVNVKFGSKLSQRKFTLQLHLMAKIYCMVQQGQTYTVRDVYYENVSLYGHQQRLETGLYDLCHILRVPREALCVKATSKGLIAGNLMFSTSSGDRIDLANFKCGMLIPDEDLQHIQSDAQFIMVVEKDAIFQRLIGEQLFATLGPMILITGKGYPDIATLKMIRKLRDSLHLQVFALVDCDPHGVEIAAVIRWGSFKQASIAKCANDLSLSERLTVPDLVWLGLLPSEIGELSLNNGTSGMMTPRDQQKINSVNQRVMGKRDTVWIQELQILKRSLYKVELEALFMHPGFAVLYIQQKLHTFFKNTKKN